MTKITALMLCVSLAIELRGGQNTTPPPAADRVSELADKIHYGLDNLLTKTSDTEIIRHNPPYIYHFIDQNVFISDTIEFKKISVTAENISVEVAMVAGEESNEGATLIGLPHHKPKFILHPNNGYPIFVDIFINSEFRRLPRHDLKIAKDYTNDFSSYVQWTLFDNQRLLFSPVGFKTSGLELPEDATNHLVQGQFVDTDLLLNGICLIDGIVYIVADNQDVTIRLKEISWLMNSTDMYQCALILIANVNRKITFVVDEAMEWRSHLNTQFFIVQAGPGKVEVKIVADDND
ncbi:MAG TPA: hypothetical protein VL201_02330 [Patescibacteria group bacterium]|jgi:hypothetical protein|nr:hypothetical protein [Patescibacteria group bacterium]